SVDALQVFTQQILKAGVTIATAQQQGFAVTGEGQATPAAKEVGVTVGWGSEFYGGGAGGQYAVDDVIELRDAGVFFLVGAFLRGALATQVMFFHVAIDNAGKLYGGNVLLTIGAWPFFDKHTYVTPFRYLK